LGKYVLQDILKVLKLTFLGQRMLAVLIMRTAGLSNAFIDCHKAKVGIAVLPMIHVKTSWNWTLEYLNRAYWLCETTHRWLQNPPCSEYWPLFTTQDEWTILMNVTELFRPFRYWTRLMSTRYIVALHHVITVYNIMFDNLDGVMRALTSKRTQWKENLFFVVKLAKQKLSKCYAKMTPTTGMLLISAHLLDVGWTL
jgi:hypothetical protein